MPRHFLFEEGYRDCKLHNGGRFGPVTLFWMPTSLILGLSIDGDYFKGCEKMQVLFKQAFDVKMPELMAIGGGRHHPTDLGGENAELRLPQNLPKNKGDGNKCVVEFIDLLHEHQV